MNRYLSIHQFGILIVLSIALSIIIFFMTAHLAPICKDNKVTFITSNATLEDYKKLRREWRPRILSNAAAHLCSIFVKKVTDAPKTQLKYTVGIYSAVWLLLINISLILAFRQRALVFMWGIFAAVAFGYTPGLVTRVYPWDMPALFFFTLFMIFHHRSYYRLLPVVILFGALFKETTIVLCIALLFLPVSWRSRLKNTVITGFIFFVLKSSVDIMVGISFPFFSPTTGKLGTDSLRLAKNMNVFLNTPLYKHPVWVNAGSLLALMILPGKNRVLLMLKCVAACLALGLFICGQISEFRIWFEAAPLAVYGIVMTFDNWELPDQSIQATK